MPPAIGGCHRRRSPRQSDIIRSELKMPVTIGTRFGSYEILSLLGVGGMGAVSTPEPRRVA
jgi:hypothetical protein